MSGRRSMSEEGRPAVGQALDRVRDVLAFQVIQLLATDERAGIDVAALGEGVRRFEVFGGLLSARVN